MITASAPLPGDPGPLTHTCRTRPALPAPVLVLLVVPLSVSRPQLPWPGQGSQDTCIDGWVFYICAHKKEMGMHEGDGNADQG